MRGVYFITLMSDRIVLLTLDLQRVLSRRESAVNQSVICEHAFKH